MPAVMIDGRAVAARLSERVAGAVRRLGQEGVTPGLAVVLVGEDPASQVYVRSKVARSGEVGIRSIEHRLPTGTAEADLLDLVERLNADPGVHGILVQMPLPAQIDADRVVLAIAPAKDVDGLHPENAGRLVLGRPGLVSCTPQGCVMLAKEHRGPDLSGLDAVVIGRSILVGKPLALLLAAENCTVTLAHSHTRDLETHARRADILVAAVGRPELVRGPWIKPGATVIDVGINRVERAGAMRLVGDVAFAEAMGVAGAVTPVPGGVGPMTIACLLRNTVLAAAAQSGLEVPAELG